MDENVGSCVEYKLVVLLDPVEEKTSGGLYKPAAIMDKEQMRSTEGVIVNIGGNCFEDWKGIIPEVGDRIIYNLNAGYIKKFDDKEYRIISDKDVLMILNNQQGEK